MTIDSLAAWPNLQRLASAVLDAWPAHRRVLDKYLGGRDAQLLDHSEYVSSLVCKLTDQGVYDLATLAQSYRFLCEKIVLPEELYFRRHNAYRLSTFEEAFREVYSNDEVMPKYMEGLLTSYAIWPNHVAASHHYAHTFLKVIAPGARMLEIGPGHGMLMYIASCAPNIRSLTGWDVSQASLDMTRQTLDHLGVTREYTLAERNIFAGAGADVGTEKFDAIVLSEVLEHLEHPMEALAAIYDLLEPGGKAWINVPVNSPLPDHIFLLRSVQEAVGVIEKAGFAIHSWDAFPAGAVTLERAVKEALTINCVIIAERPARQ